MHRGVSKHDVESPPCWVELVHRGGYITPAQRQAFEQAIQMVSGRLNLVLSKKDQPRTGQFNFDAFVDSLENDFLKNEDNDVSPGLSSDIGQTAFWVIRSIADQLITLQKQRQVL
ncbi:DNA-binding protein [Pectobacteriaceae bacterium CE70]|nr:DNA-binding protein [Pectobacteriaceae bacterium C52]WJV68883.1 DNA-binding protein [Pectobacteriaceae bacterium CE70]WJY12806.1 DNA-binding protein [Pectobacteriaceae bacterium C80]